MVKKSLSVILALTMLLACMVPVGAAYPPLRDIDANLSVDANILVKNSAEGEYGDADLSVTTNSVMPKFDFKAVLKMGSVETKFKELFSKDYITGLLNSYNVDDEKYNKIRENTWITGEMTTVINVPAGVQVNPAFITVKDMNGFGFTESTATLSTLYTEPDARVNNNGQITITTKIGPIKATVLEENDYALLGDLYLECKDNQVLTYGTHTITGSVTGYTDICYLDTNNKIYKIAYTAKQDTTTGETALAETVSVSQPFSGGGGGITEVVPNITVDFSVNGNKDIITPKRIKGSKLTVDLDEIGIPEIPGYVPAGTWTSDPEGTKPVSGKVTVTEDTTFYISYICVTSPSVFTENHVRYVQGYPDGEVKPENNVTREEVTAMLYRLLKPDVRQSLKSEANMFTDVESDRWSNIDISTMVKGGYINGYPDGTFKPGNKITRAEFVTLITRFIDDDLTALGNVSFNDISSHWAEESILAAAKYGVITGYPDGSFGPDKFITRAEAMSIINKLLVRYVTDDGLHEDTKHWPDNPDDAWYYHHVLEATNSHHHDRMENGYHEDWYDMTGIEDWTHE